MFNKQKVKRLPKISELNKEFTEILAEKKEDYAEYKKVKAEMQEYLIAKQNIENLMGPDSSGKEKTGKEKSL